MDLGNTKEDNLKKFGFSDEVKRVKFDLCPFCSQPVKMEDFKNALSRKEYFISGICQKCQDGFFE